MNLLYRLGRARSYAVKLLHDVEEGKKNRYMLVVSHAVPMMASTGDGDVSEKRCTLGQAEAICCVVL